MSKFFKYLFVFLTLQRYELYFNYKNISRKFFKKMNIFIFKIILVKYAKILKMLYLIMDLIFALNFGGS